MKRFIIALAAVIAAFGFTSCEKEASKAIVGTWEATTVEMQMGPVTMEMDIAETGSEVKVTFKKDGVATMTETSEGESITMDLSYSVEDNILIMEEVQTIVALGAGSITKRVFGDGRIERCDNVKDVGLYIEKIDEMIERKRKLFESQYDL